MQSLSIHKLKLKYRLPSRDADAVRRRLDRVLREVLDSALEAALDRLGVPASAEICIRRLYVPVHLRFSDTESSLARIWGTALAASVKRAADGAHVSGVVFYESRARALYDLARGVANGRLERAWAWRQLGLWRAGERVDERQAREQLVLALCTEPRLIVPVLCELAETGILGRLASGLTAEQWTRLAQSALAVVGARAKAGDFQFASGESFADFDALSNTVLTRTRARRVLNASRLARVFAQFRVTSRAHMPHAPEFQVFRALVVLVTLEVEPGMFRASRDASAALVGAVAKLLLRSGVDSSEESHTASEESPEESSSLDSRRPETRGADERDVDAPPESARRRAFTRFGGLLYLLGVIEDLGLPEEMAEHPLLSERTLRWTLQQIALRLLPLDAGDAAALAFAGLRPEEEAPAMLEGPPDEAEAAAIDSFVARIVVALRARLEWHEQPADELLRFVCQRRAEIVAEPGWIDVRMSLDEVSTEIRRSGLDLNPGYVAWLGVVVRFVYE